MAMTSALLRAIFPRMTEATAEAFAAPLSESMDRFGIRSSWQMASFLAQCAHESACFTKLEEGLWYTKAERLVAVWPTRFWHPGTRSPVATPGRAEAALYLRNPERVANWAYANRMGNGGPESGDGHRFRGRGIIQLTGRDNYTACDKALRLGLIESPHLLTQPRESCLSAGWFWRTNGLNAFADRQDFEGMTKRINGGLHGLAEREAYLADALELL